MITRQVLNKILDILNDSGAVLEEENGHVVLRIGSVTEPVPVNYLKRDYNDHEECNKDVLLTATPGTTTGIQQPNIRDNNVSATRRRSLRKLPNNGDKNSNINNNLAQPLDKKQNSNKLPAANKTHNKKADFEKDRELVAVDVSESSSFIKIKRDEAIDRRKSLRSFSIANRAKNQNDVTLARAKVPSLLSDPLHASKHDQKKDEKQKQRKRTLDVDDDDGKQQEGKTQNGLVISTPIKKRRLLDQSTVDGFCKTSNNKLKQKIENRGISLFGNNQVKLSSPYKTRSVSSNNQSTITKTDPLTIVYQEDGDVDDVAKKGAGKKAKAFMLQQRDMASNISGERSLQQLIRQNTSMLNLYRYWVAWSSLKNTCDDKKHINSNVHEFLFGRVKGKNDTEMEKTMKYMKAGERLSKLAQKYGDFIVLIPEIFIPSVFQQITDKEFNVIQKRLSQDKKFENTMSDLSQISNEEGALYDILWTKIGNE
ncbi:hypothetical protein INT45_009000 [Circinella minor]|uniref:Uncharacterized protein n=1 Tax=Circinella minor TaxID=1195481 RepID=A0A8H7VNU8_9FUNG|nr:hypothetical protein INT45_009000 [Circinella minor]